MSVELFVDPVALVGYLLAEFDGSDRMAAEIRRAMLRAVRGLPTDHLVRETIDNISGDLTVAEFAVDSGGNLDDFRRRLVERWQGAAPQIKRAQLH